MNLKKIISIKTSILSIFATSSALANCNDYQDLTLSFESFNEDRATDINSRIQVIKSLDLESMTESEKDSLIMELLDSNSSTLRLIENRDIDLRRYRNEAGSHSFSM